MAISFKISKLSVQLKNCRYAAMLVIPVQKVYFFYPSQARYIHLFKSPKNDIQKHILQ